MWAYNNLDGNCGLTLVKVQGNHNRELLHLALYACPVPTHSDSCSLPTAHTHILGAQPSQPGRRLQLINNSGCTALRCSREVLPVRATTKFVWCDEALGLVLQKMYPSDVAAVGSSVAGLCYGLARLVCSVSFLFSIKLQLGKKICVQLQLLLTGNR